MSIGWDRAQANRRRLQSSAAAKAKHMSKEQLLEELARVNQSPIARKGFLARALVARLKELGVEYFHAG